MEFRGEAVAALCKKWCRNKKSAQPKKKDLGSCSCKREIHEDKRRMQSLKQLHDAWTFSTGDKSKQTSITG